MRMLNKINLVSLLSGLVIGAVGMFTALEFNAPDVQMPKAVGEIVTLPNGLIIERVE